MQVKKGVNLSNLKREMYHAHKIMGEVCKEYGVHACITSGIDGNHEDSTLHYIGQALDFRTWWWWQQRAKLRKVRDEVQQRLSKISIYYQVVISGNCLHIEFDDRKTWIIKTRNLT